MKKLLLVLTVAAFLFGLFACGGGDSPEAVMNDMLGLFEDYIDGMDNAQSADDVVKVIDKFSAGMQKLAPRVKALEEKYPELKQGMKGGKMPEELKEFEDKFKELMPKFMGVMGKIMQYANDPKVQDAQKRFEEAMKSME